MLSIAALFLSAAMPDPAWLDSAADRPLPSRPVVRASATILRGATASPVAEPGEVYRQVRWHGAERVRVEFE